MKKTIITAVITSTIMALLLIGGFLLLRSGDDNAPQNTPDVITGAVEPPVTGGQLDSEEGGTGSMNVRKDTTATPPAAPQSDSTKTPLDIGVASFTYDRDKVIFDEIPSDVENGAPMVTFMPSNASEPLPRVDCTPLTVSASGEGDANFYNITEENWENLAASMVLKYYTEAGQQNASIEMNDTVVKIDGTSAKMFTSIHVSIPENVTEATGDMSLSGTIRLVAQGDKAVITTALTQPGVGLPSELYDAYMSLQINAG